MPPVDPLTLQTASLQASEWFVLLNSGKATVKQQQAFAQWLKQSSIHQQAWRETQNLWQGSEQLTPKDIAELTTRPFSSAKATQHRLFTFPIYAFSTLALLLAALMFKQPFWYVDYYTNTSESKQITLSDGSTVELNAGSAISIDFTENRREIKLHYGEAFFTVAADSARPFDVLAGEAEIRALGTAFNINLDGEDMQVTVFEHAVRVTAGNHKIENLSHGNAVTLNDKDLGQIIPQNLATIDSWRQHRLIFEDKKLGDVVKTLNRYRVIPIIILGIEVKNLYVTGLFDTQDTDTALQTIEETLAVKIRRLPGGFVLLSGA
jgi:transmembrane sensor